MTLRLYDTLSRSPRAFEPADPGHVRMYTCGPTVYDRAHIGNFRTFTWEDLLRRYLEWKGWRVTQVMNLTDVDDKTIHAAVERGLTLEEVTEPVIAGFFEDWETLGLEPAEHHPRATEHVAEMIELVETLEEKGYCYEADGSVYFAIGRFPDYGRLARLDPESLRSAGRASGDEEYSKDDPRDFVLWKGGERAEEGDVATWDSPWGPGRPGWHLECSVLAMEYLGPTLDIHTGGVDNIFPHHTNEIAQSEAATGRTFARFWLHAAHLLVEGAKMSKSEGNYFTVPDLVERGHRPSAIRYLLLSAHYRSQLNFTVEGLEQADRALDRIDELGVRLAVAPDRDGGPEASGAPGDASPDPLARAAERARAAFEAALDDDLAVSGALAAVFEFVRDANAVLDSGGGSAAARKAARGFLDDFDAVFGVLSLREGERIAVPAETERWLEQRIAERRRARSEGDFERADAIRDEVAARGFVLEDTPTGTRWKLPGSGAGSAAGVAVPDGGSSPAAGGERDDMD
ncbi:MAG: cysteine--tRNA ligase [Candidatus Palauibacterales bacterium]|nr:cysteine--tRNA ligase [Candidatus Palauibacterales bacterium]MDP2530671.1 cysteine--tRNA ligase [Candidatus Palauibacterales bacterium]